MKTKILGFILLLGIGGGSCKKDHEDNPQVASINVVNAAIDVAAIKVNASGNLISWATIIDQVNYGANKFYYGAVGNMGSIIAVSSTDTSKILFRRDIKFQPKIYSMYVFGNSSGVDTLLREEVDFPFIPIDKSKYNSADSVVNVRFVNLSFGSPGVNINIKNSITNEVVNLGYKGISSFKAYPNKLVGTTNYIFEFRNSITNDLMTTYTFGATATNRFKNVALIIKGVYVSPPGLPITGTNAFSVFPSNYF